LCIDHHGTLWIATNGGGLNRFNAKKEQFISYRHDPDDLHTVSSNKIMSVYEDRAGVMWVGTADRGLNILDRETETFRQYLNDANDPSSLSDNMVWHIFEDRTGILWLGTWGGINKIVPRKNQFRDIKKIPENPSSLPDEHAGAIHISNHEDKETLWIGTRKGLIKIDPETGKYTRYLHDKSGVNSISITALCEDHYSILWIGTHEHGLIKFDPLKQKFKSYLHNPQNPHSISSNRVYSVYEDKQGVLWIGTYNGSFEMFDRRDEVFRHQFKYPVLHIFEDSYSELWIAAWPGLRKYNRKTGDFIIYSRGDGAVNWPELNRTNFILEPHFSEKDILWTGTYSGLNHFDRRTGEFVNYTIKDGLPSNVINSMLEDKEGNLWLGTNNGLSRFNPRTKSFKNFDVNDGLLSGQFSPGACAQSKDGRMFFCSSKGVSAFYPDNIVDNMHIPKIVISDFQIFNKSVEIKKGSEQTESNRLLLNQHISLTEEITLSYQHNVFAFQFAALDYNSPPQNQYAYRMEGVDPDWIYTNASRRFAIYTNLDPGQYIFKVKGSNNDGVWNETGKSVKIFIIPPWWKSQLAYILYFIFFIAVAITTWRMQLRRIHLRQQIQMEHFEAEKLREVDHIKSRFFANISHEFRTPLTLILGPVRQMLSGEFSGNFKEQYKMIIRSSERLLHLINQLLDLSKLESGKMKLQAEGMEIVRFTNNLYQAYESLATGRQIYLKFSSEPERKEVYLDPEKYETVINNLLSNAFKATPDGGEIRVDISYAEPKLVAPRGILDQDRTGKKKYINISVSNTGPGIPSDQLKHIFDRFYQAENKYKKDEEGSGIGLALTRELVELHHGKIRVESNSDTKTTFSILLPLGKEHLKPDELSDKIRSKDFSRGPEFVVLQDKVEESGETEIKDHHPKTSILIVEDNADLRRHININMNHTYAIIEAENGEEGFNLAIEKSPDLIISDVMMPVIDGFEFCSKIKTDERTSHIPVILLTARAGQEDKIEGLETGADDYVTKPFDIKELKIRAKNLIEQRRRLREKFARDTDFFIGSIASTSADEKFIRRILDIIFKHISEADFHMEDLAKESGISRSQLHRKISGIFGQSPGEFLRTIRLKRGAELLKEKTGNISEIAYQVGFDNPANFSTSFRRQFGIPPSEYRKNLHKA
jgi:signal transduction histidine kinase/CheY-like chemotaxis protein/streptogramin lyase